MIVSGPIKNDDFQTRCGWTKWLLRDVLARDEASATRMLNAAVETMLEYVFYSSGQPMPRIKYCLGELCLLDTTVGELAQQYYVSHNANQRLQLAERIAKLTVGETGFFEWESEQSPVELSN